MGRLVTARDVLNHLTTVHWLTAADLARQIAASVRTTVTVAEIAQHAWILEADGAILRQPREDAGHRYGEPEFQLTPAGAERRHRENTGATWSPSDARPIREALTGIADTL